MFCRDSLDTSFPIGRKDLRITCSYNSYENHAGLHVKFAVK